MICYNDRVSLYLILTSLPAMVNMLSVIIPTYNPNLQRLIQTVSGLKAQSLPASRWELIIVDNNSSIDFMESISLEWHPNFKMIREPRQGLTYARVSGFKQAQGEIIVLVDDDNILGNDYLKNTLEIFSSKPDIGAIGGKSIPLFEKPAPEWVKEFYGNLALRDLGDRIVVETWRGVYPPTAPVGAGIAVRKAALESYIARVASAVNPVPDRQGKSLGSGGDNDIVLEILKSGWQIGYFPNLTLTHIIPCERLRPEYLARLINNTNRSWVAVLEFHQINPWKKIPRWSAPLRKIKAWFTYAAWKNKVSYIRWRGACGLYDGLADTKR